MKYTLSFLTAVLLSSTAVHAQTTLAKWTFESLTFTSGSPLTNATSCSGVNAEVGSGTASGVHATACVFSTPAGNGSTKALSSDHWSVNDYYQFAVSTVGYGGISISWAQASSGTGPSGFNLAYSTDGVNFTTVNAYTTGNGSFSASSTCSTCSHSFDFSSIPALNNSPTVYFRLIDNSTTSVNNGTVGTGGTDRVDDFTVAGTAIGSLQITQNPVSRTNNAQTVATFQVTATGNSPTYQWQKDNNNISDNPSAFSGLYGTTTPTLIVSNVLIGDAGGYRLIVTDNSGSKTSLVATLTVIDPAITTQPFSRTNVAGDNGNFFVAAAGTPFFLYQWRFNGVDIPNATATTLNVPNLDPTNQGAYTVVAMNGNNVSVTSSVANLTLLATPSVRVAEWDFDATNSYPATAPVPSVGSGTASLIGSTTATFGSGSFSDNAALPGLNNSGWNSAGYPAQGTANKTAGVQFKVSTVGYKDILLTWEERHSNTASKYTRLQYSVDGINFVDGPSIVMSNTNNEFVFYSANLSGVTALNNNPNFAFQIVSEWESTAIGGGNANYDATVTTYGTSGTIRYDLVNVFANPGSSDPSLSSQLVNGKLVISWADSSFTLQASPVVNGTYTNVPTTGTSYTNDLSAAQMFFRLGKQVP